MKLPGWKSLGGGRYETPGGENVSRRQYLNVQAQSVGYTSYSEYQRISQNNVYRNAIASTDNPREARRLDSPFSSTFAKNILPHWREGTSASKAAWKDAFDALDLDYDDSDLWEWYSES